MVTRFGVEKLLLTLTEVLVIMLSIIQYRVAGHLVDYSLLTHY